MTPKTILRDVQDKSLLESFFRQNTALHIYSIGDLDDFFWPYTTWYALQDGIQLTAVILVYRGQSLPTVLAIGDKTKPLYALLNGIAPDLPDRFYAHISPGAEQILKPLFKLTSHGLHLKMALSTTERVVTTDTRNVELLSTHHSDELMAFYRSSYPGNWFDPRMLDTNQYYGIRLDDQLVSVAGIHVYSPSYRVAALGNIVTHPEYRRQSLGLKTTARVCQSLTTSVDHIGLNVKADNLPAINCYQKLGFETIGEYGEFMVERM
ncbi:MAG: GNAT family N-acetyltransferase [Candidatus Marinimicrobia bacterium]|nr:GNAT family N-acetyltransferase [Candidatus Neomarinimicrobiota bacterium]